MSRWARRLILPALLVGAALAVRPVAAQDNPPFWRWVDAQGGFCIWYLADPDIARGLLPPGVTARTSAETGELPELLLRIVQDEPRFAQWVPGLVCVGRFAVVAANGQPVANMERSGRPVLYALTALAARGGGGGDDLEWQLLELGLDADRLDRVGNELNIASKDRSLRVRQGVEGEDDQWALPLEGAELIWSGHRAGVDRVGSTRVMSFGYVGRRNTVWRIDLRMVPGREQDQVGSLRVEGRGDLAQALKSSPIRAVAALQGGGEATMTFHLRTTRAP
jgi:hypothetical protein